MRPFALFFSILLIPALALAQEEDPYLWLEGVEDDNALSWVRDRNAVSESEIGARPGFQALQDRIRANLDSDARIPYVGRLGTHEYNFWKDKANPRGLWRRTTWTEYQKTDPKWETVIDVDALGKQEGVNWVWAGADCLAPKYERCLVGLSRGGADAKVIREFDLPSGTFVDGGFSLPEAKSDVAWRDADSLWVSTDFGPGTMTDSGYPMEVRRWDRGTELAAATKVFAGEKTDVSVSAAVDHSTGFERHWIVRGPTFWTTKVQVLQGEQWVALDKPDDAQFSSFREWLFLELRSEWTVGGATHPSGSLLAIRLDAFLRGERAFDVLFRPDARRSLGALTFTKNHVVLRILDNVRSRIEIKTPKKTGWATSTIPGLPELGTLSVSAVDADHNDDVFVTSSDYITPTTLSLATIGKGKPKVMKSLPAFFDTAGLRVEQFEATSADGTKVPYFQVSRTTLAMDGKAPTLLYGYGGFEIPLLPGYNANVGSAWLERGGVYVVANIRGGGEFGPTWHQAALKAMRHRAYEDFSAVGRHLVERKVTSADHLGIMGGSNGGLLMGNMVALYPELFEAVVCMVPLLDMRRFNKLLAGASWMGEYGNPDVPEEWAFIRTFSPYHLLDAKKEYPRVLFTTSTRDDRVHPGHARKMAARMLEYGKDVLYYENIEGGHGGAADNGQAAHMWALAYTFLWEELN